MTKQMFQCDNEPLQSEFTGDQALNSFHLAVTLAGRDCRAQLDTVENHLEINGITITDTLVTEEKEKKKRFGIF
jgi:hypothetical protein